MQMHNFVLNCRPGNEIKAFFFFPNSGTHIRLPLCDFYSKKMPNASRWFPLALRSMACAMNGKIKSANVKHSVQCTIVQMFDPLNPGGTSGY
jgi:hypothetical protein